MTRLLQDLRYACRTLRKSPVFAAVAILTLALGIGANSAIFTLINAALLRPLPFPHPERLALVWEETAMFGLKDSPVALGNYADWRAQNRSFEAMGALERGSVRLTGAGEAQQIQCSGVTASVLETLGVKPALGRPFSAGEDLPGAAKTAILSDGLWRRAFGADPAVVGRTIELEDEHFVVAGVMPAGFRFPDSEIEVWLPTGMMYGPKEFVNRGRHNWMVVARLKPGVTMAQANQDIRGIAARAEREFPGTNAKVGAFVAPLRDHFVADQRTMLAALAGAVGFVLLIACANIANLLLSRASHRRREVAIRTAVGAGRWQIARQLLTENLLLSVAGGICGLVLALGGVRFLQKVLPGGISAMSAVNIDLRVLAFTLGVSLLTGVIFGLAPAFQTLRVDLHQTLKQGGGRQGTRGASHTVENWLVISEVALAFVLTVGAALMIQAFTRLRAIDPGFRTKDILTLKTPMGSRQYREPARRAAYYDQVVDRLKALPGVVSAGFTLGPPLAFKGWVNGFQVEGRPADTLSNANFRVVTPEYVETIGIPLRSGRYLSRHDTPDAPPVMLVNESMARRFWPGESALGKRIRFREGTPWVPVVGIVGDIKQAGLDVAPKPEMYLSVAQDNRAISWLVVRTARDPKGVAAAVRGAIRSVDPGMPVTDLRTMEQVLDREVFERRTYMLLISIFAAMALLLASLGIYGVLAYLVAQRTQEIGIRMALGARPADVLRNVAGKGVALSAAGIAIGAAGAFALTRLLEKLLFGIKATDPTTFAGTAAILLAVASLASYIPARRAMRVDPILALREE